MYNVPIYYSFYDNTKIKILKLDINENRHIISD